MAKTAAWALIALALIHLLFGILRYKEPLAGAVSDGFVGQFAASEQRRTAFWFLLFALPMLLGGQLALRAANVGDLATIRLIGYYVLGIAVVGLACFPRSPFWLPLALGPFLIYASAAR
jgi:hypothetical protein